MPLPELNTSGIDISNTVAKINAMKTNDMQRQNLQSEIIAREAQAPVLNAMRVLQNKELEQKIASSDLDESVKAVSFIKGIPTPEAQEAAYVDYAKTMAATNPRIKPPALEVFYTNGKWDLDKFSTSTDMMIRARSLQLDPSIGKDEWLPVPTDPSKPVSDTNPLVLKRYISKGYGKIELDTEAPVKPYVDPVAKDKRDERRLDQADAKLAAVGEANRIREEGLIRAGENAEKRGAVNEKYLAALATAALMNASTNKTKAEKTGLPEVKKTVKNAAGEMIHIMTDGSVKVMGLGTDGQPAWIPATAEQIKGVNLIGVSPKKKGRFSGENTETKPATQAIMDSYANSGKYKTKQEVRDAAKKDGYDIKGF